VHETQLTRFERQVLDLLIGTTGEAAPILGEQAAVATVVQRSAPGGSGAHVWLDVPDHAPRLGRGYTGHIRSVDAILEADEVPRLDASFLLHIAAGALERVEIIAPGAPWPARPRLRSHSATRGQVPKDALP
jgi:hypothetical protein